MTAPVPVRRRIPRWLLVLSIAGALAGMFFFVAVPTVFSCGGVDVSSPPPAPPPPSTTNEIAQTP